jgi:hypothetical protein
MAYELGKTFNENQVTVLRLNLSKQKLIISE